MTLQDLLHGVTATPIAAVPITGIARDSKRVRPGDLFVAIRGAVTDGHAYINEAISRGAAAVVADTLPARPPRSCPCVLVSDTRAALTVAASRFYGNPAHKLRLIGVTGTNGKTTTTYLLRAMLDAHGARTGLLGTVAYQIGERVVPSTNTTPGPLELQRYFAQMVGEGLEWCVMEASSHALAQGRLDGVRLSAAIFCNLGSDHLDYHRTREAYAAAKRRLFDYLDHEGVAVINVDDPFGRTLAQTVPQGRVVTVGLESRATVTARDLACGWQGSRLSLVSPWGRAELTTALLGRHNLPNVLTAAAALLALGVPMETVVRGLRSAASIPGRLERVPLDQGPQVFVDYAHTADALRMVLQSLRELATGRLIVVFGCGGDRDRAKRPVMGRVAGQLADGIILTSDNPRTEDPLRIIEEIRTGLPDGFAPCQVVPDREQAILAALQSAQPGDVVLVAGKGHEAYQQFDHVSVPFSDRAVIEHWAATRQPAAVSA